MKFLLPLNLVNQTLDRLPPHIWNNPEVTFLDPFCKSGIFLREITKRLLGGLEHSIPDIEERIKHILLIKFLVLELLN